MLRGMSRIPHNAEQCITLLLLRETPEHKLYLVESNAVAERYVCHNTVLSRASHIVANRYVRTWSS